MLNQSLYDKSLALLNQHIPDDYAANGIYRKLISAIAWLGYRNLLNATEITKQAAIATADEAKAIGKRAVTQPQTITGVTVVYASKLDGTYVLSYSAKDKKLSLGSYAGMTITHTSEYDLVPYSESVATPDYDLLIADNHFVVTVEIDKLPIADCSETITITDRIGIDYLSKAASERNKKRYSGESPGNFRERVINGTGDETILSGIEYELTKYLGYAPRVTIYADEYSNWFVVGYSCIGYAGLSSNEVINNGLLQERYRGSHIKEQSDCQWHVYIEVRKEDLDNQMLRTILDRTCSAVVEYHLIEWK